MKKHVLVLLWIAGAMVACGGAIATEGTTNDTTEASSSSGSSGRSSSSGTSGSPGGDETPVAEDVPPDPGVGAVPPSPSPEGCGATTKQYPIDPTRCEAQVASQSRYGLQCGGFICHSEIVFPCDPGPPPPERDAGKATCDDLCRAYGPARCIADTRTPNGRRVVQCGQCYD